MAAVFGSTNWRHNLDLKHFAGLVHQLRAAQKAGGSGYKTPADNEKATALEKRVDALVSQILQQTP